MDNYKEEFIQNLKFYRKQRNISQEKLAELCGCATATIGCIESGKQFPSFNLLFNMAKALKLNPADFFIRDSSKLQDKDLFYKYSQLLYCLETIPDVSRSSIELMISDMSKNYNIQKKSKK